MITSSRRFHFSTVLGLCALTFSTFPVQAQPPEVAIQTPEEVKKAQEPKPLPLVTWDELQEQFSGPTLITLHAKEMPIAEVIDALSKQSPIPVTIQNRQYLEQQNKKTLTADYEKQPFWEVALDIAKTLGIGIQNYGGNQSITFTPWSSESEGITSSAGAGIFNLSSASYNRYVRQSKGDESRNESLNLNCTLFADPKLQWQNQGMAVHLTEALDDKNQSLLPENDSDVYSHGIPIDMNMQLKPRAIHGGTLQSLRGTFHGVVAFVSENWEVGDVLNANNVEKIVTTGDSSTRLELQDVKLDGEGYRVTLVISQNNATNQQGARLSTGKQIWMNDSFYNKLRLVDAEGRDLQMRQSSSNVQGNAEGRITTFTSVFHSNPNGEGDNLSGPPAKFLMHYDSDWRELILPFEFKNVNLP